MPGSERNPLVLGRVIGDVIDPFTRVFPFRVIYNGRKVNNGCDLRPSAVSREPRIEVGESDMRTLFSLVSTHTYVYMYDRWINGMDRRLILSD